MMFLYPYSSQLQELDIALYFFADINSILIGKKYKCYCSNAQNVVFGGREIASTSKYISIEL